MVKIKKETITELEYHPIKKIEDCSKITDAMSVLREYYGISIGIRFEGLNMLLLLKTEETEMK